VREFGPWLRGRVLEVGAGIGQLTALIRDCAGVEALVAVEPDPGFCRRLREDLPDVETVEGTVAAVDPSSVWDALISVNVLEHIADDAAELSAYRRLLTGRGGHLCLFVPAGPGLLSPMDRDFGHHRRYTRGGLRRLLVEAGFDVLRLHPFNMVGYFAWWLAFKVLRRRRFNPAAVRFFDRRVFPVMHAWESRVVRPPFGQSLLAVANCR